MPDRCPQDSGLWPAVMGELIAEHVRSHIDRCGRCADRVRSFQTQLQSFHGRLIFPAASEPGSPELPESIGEYALLAVLGRGGQADVYRAWHPRLRIDVVLKWYRHTLPDIPETPHWSRSMQALCTVRHPNLGQLYDAGVEQGRPYLVMEYVRGHTLGKWMETFQPSLLRILKVLSDVARAVEAVHQHGALHLDLKPENILIDEAGNPRVIDFSMARFSNGISEDVLPPATPEYMSPEQCIGDMDRIGVASDVYGMGAVLFSVLTGKTLRSPDHLTLEPDWKLLRNAPHGVARICRRALSIQPEKRQKSAIAFARDLDRYLRSTHWTGKVFSSAALILAGWAFMITPEVTSEVPDFRSYIAAKQASDSGRNSTIQLTSHIETQGKPYWSLTTCGASSAKIQPQEVIAARSPGGSWRSKVNLSVSPTVGPCLLVVCNEADWQAMPTALSSELSLLTNDSDTPLYAEIDERGVRWQNADGETQLRLQNQLRPVVDNIQLMQKSSIREFQALLTIPPRTSDTVTDWMKTRNTQK